MHIFFSSGEPSGDQHAAQVVRAIRSRVPNARFSGFGGPHFQATGAEMLFQLTDMAVMGVTAVLPLIRRFYQLAQQGKRFIEEQKPDAVVLIDFSGFNWYIAKYAKQAGIPVYYYCPPQLWAWASWRIRRVRKYVDCILSVLPFEAEWYRNQGVKVEYVGHPFFDEVAERPLDQPFIDGLRPSGERLISILPGSRKHEVTHNFPVFLEVARRLHQAHPDVRFPVACYKESQRDFCAEQIAKLSEPLPIDLYVGRTPEIIAAGDCCMMVSGSVSLEVLARSKPAVVSYHANWFNYLFGKLVVHIKYMSLPNLLRDRVIMPEFLFVSNRERQANNLHEVLSRWLTSPLEMQATAREMESLRSEIVQTGGVAKAADTILQLLGHSSSQRAAA